MLDWRSPSFLAKSGARVKIKNKTTKKIEIGVNALYGTLLVLFVTSLLEFRAARYHQSPFPPIFLRRETDFAEKA